MVEVKKNRQKLRQIMAEYDIKGAEVARLTGRQLPTVHIWMSKTGDDIRDETLCYLQYRLQQEIGECA